jgi:hypothetical protein
MKTFKIGMAGVLAIALTIAAARIAAAGGPTGWGYPSCLPVTAFPANINAPGVYCLGFKYIDFPLPKGVLITISSDNVVFDLNGATLDGTPKGNAFSYGIMAYNRRNVTIRNGTLRGFNYGIYLYTPLGYVNTRVRPSHHILVENMRLIENRTSGMYVIAYDSVIRKNHIIQTGGSADPGLAASTWGMIVAGDGTRILDNDITNTHVNTAYGGGTTTGIYLAGGLNFTIVNNRINEADFGIYGGNGNWGKFRDNVTTAVGVPFTGGTNLGNNN